MPPEIIAQLEAQDFPSPLYGEAVEAVINTIKTGIGRSTGLCFARVDGGDVGSATGGLCVPEADIAPRSTVFTSAHLCRFQTSSEPAGENSLFREQLMKNTGLIRRIRAMDMNARDDDALKTDFGPWDSWVSTLASFSSKRIFLTKKGVQNS